MKTYTKPSLKFQPISDPPLLERRIAVVRRTATRAGEYVMRRYRIAPHMAEVIAFLAGLGCDREARQ